MHKSMNEIKELQKQWKTIGPVPYKVKDEIWERFQSTCQRVFQVSRPDNKQHKPKQSYSKFNSVMNDLEQ